jgi:beta-lactamase class A
LLARAIQELEASASATWGVSVALDAGEALDGSRATERLRVASVAKLLLLVAMAERMEDGSLGDDEPIERKAEDAVADSGLWQHLRQDALPAADVGLLIGAVSDNLATNAMLRRIDLEAVAATAERLGLQTLALHDKVRDVRGPDAPPALASGSAAELRSFFARLGAGDLVDAAISARVRRWVATNTDLSMVASAFCLDPLAHFELDRGIVLVNKTGTNAGVRADAGYVEGPAGSVAYAVIANWAGADRRDAVLAAMRRFGWALRNAIVEA